MKKQSKHIDLKSFSLAILLFFAFGAKEMHHFLEHAHKEVKICDAKDGEQHIHDEEYASDNCSLCDFTFSIFDFTLPTFYLNHTKLFFSEKEFHYISFKLSYAYFLPSLRGPPSFL